MGRERGLVRGGTGEGNGGKLGQSTLYKEYVSQDAIMKVTIFYIGLFDVI